MNAVNGRLGRWVFHHDFWLKFKYRLCFVVDGNETSKLREIPGLENEVVRLANAWVVGDFKARAQTAWLALMF
jgi:hypothetical protein